MSSKNIKTKISILVSIAFFIMTSMMVYLEISHHKNNIESDIEQTNKQLNIIYDNGIKKLTKFYSARLKAIISDDEIKEALLVNDREKLYNLVQKKYQMLKIENPYLSILHFHTTDNKSFLRVHAKDKFGDNLSEYRKIVADTNMYKKEYSGFEVGKAGLYYRITTPIMYNKDGKILHIGSAEIGINAKYLIDEINSYLPSFDSILLTKSDKILPDTNKTQFINFGGYSKLSNCEEDFFDPILKNFDYNLEYNKIRTDNKEYIIHSNLNLIDYQSNIIGKILIASNITKIIDEYHQNIVKILLFAIITYILILVIVNYSFKILISELENLNNNLEAKVQEEVERLKSNEKLLIQQSKLATMGEMLSMIAHQWRQPLTAINSIIQSIELKDRLGKLDSVFLKNQVEQSKNIIMQMSQTIDDFRNFFKPNKDKEVVNIKSIIDKTIIVVKPILEKNNIMLNIFIDNDTKINTYPNELMQVFLNIINNAKDALIENDIANPKIDIITKSNNGMLIVDINDNGGGIPIAIIDKIFDPYFSTKSKNGTGLGLYMSKIIINNHLQGKLIVKNLNQGASFRIKLYVDK